MIGRLKELDVNPGDVVEFVSWSDGDTNDVGNRYVIMEKHPEGYSDGLVAYAEDGYFNVWGDEHDIRYVAKFRIISRASDTPKAWSSMTDAEKGALLLAKYEGKVIESFFSLTGWVSYQGLFYQEKAYRIKPEPEVITYNWFGTFADGFSDMAATDATHILIFNTINGEPDLSSIKMEKI